MILYLLTPYILALFPKKGIDNNKQTELYIYIMMHYTQI